MKKGDTEEYNCGAIQRGTRESYIHFATGWIAKERTNCKNIGRPHFNSIQFKNNRNEKKKKNQIQETYLGVFPVWERVKVMMARKSRDPTWKKKTRKERSGREGREESWKVGVLFRRGRSDWVGEGKAGPIVYNVKVPKLPWITCRLRPARASSALRGPVLFFPHNFFLFFRLVRAYLFK